MSKVLEPQSIIANGWSLSQLAESLGWDVRALAELLSSTPAESSGNPTSEAVAKFHRHWNMSTTDLARLIEDNHSLRSFIMGYGAELQLRKRFFENQRQFTDLRKEDDHDRDRKGDLTVSYMGREFVIEVKSLQTNSMRWDAVAGQVKCEYQCDASDSRYVKFRSEQKHQTTSLLRGEFDILAVCLFPLTHDWDFLFALNEKLSSPSRGKLRDPGGKEHGRNLNDDERSQLIKGSQTMFFGKGWSVSPGIYFGSPEEAMDEMLRNRTRAVMSPNIVSNAEKRRKAEERSQNRKITRKRAEEARQYALEALGSWTVPS